MNVNKAIAILKKESWIHDVVKIPNRGPKEKRWFIHREHGDPNIHYLNNDERTDREIIKAARLCQSGDAKYKKNVKFFTKKMDRAATRDAIKSEDFDKIPQNKRIKEDDIWNWD